MKRLQNGNRVCTYNSMGYVSLEHAVAVVLVIFLGRGVL